MVSNYTQVSVDDIQEVSELGLVFENVEVMSFDMKSVKHLFFGDSDKLYHVNKNTDFKLKSNEDPYLNTDITIIDSDDTIKITIKKPDDK